jgi:hypothetical protein
MAGSDNENIFDEYARNYPALITAKQAADISHREIQTIYDWSSRGLLERCKAKRSGRLLLKRDNFIRFILDDESGMDAGE